MGRLTLIAAVAALLSSTVLADDIPTCGPNKQCPEEAPCCSLYGQCGVGAYCLGGCDPIFSHKLESCVTAPVCKDATYNFKDLDNVQAINKYLGDRDQADWVSSGQPAVYDGSLLMTMAQDTVGTLLASSHYVWYGKISAKMTSSAGKGVVTAFIMMSDVKDEIDFEWVGADLTKAQTNYYSQGVTVYTNSENLTTTTTNEDVHEYTIDWKPDEITWAIDGDVMRTVKRSDTWNATSNRFDYPQTPARVMLSLWPAGLPTNAKGTIDWAGGEIDWNSQYMQNGYYYAMVQEVSVECYDTPDGANIAGSKSYIYTNNAGTNSSIQMTDDVVVLKSLIATGEKPEAGDPAASASATGAQPSQTVQSVPGMVGGGARSEESEQQQSDNSGNGGDSTSGDPSQTVGIEGLPTGNSNSFNQGVTGQSGASSGRSMEGSILAACVALFGLLVL